MKKVLLTLFYIFFIQSFTCISQNSILQKKLNEVDSIIYAHQGELAIPIIDSLLQDNLSTSTQLHLKAFKLEALIQVQKLESAFYLSTQIFEDPNLKGQALIRTYIERALLFELSKEVEQSKKALDFVEAYYNDDKHQKDELYGEYLYRLSSWYRIQDKTKEAIEYAQKAVEFGRKNKFANVEATGLLVLDGTTPNHNIPKKIALCKRALELWKKSANFSHALSMHINIGYYTYAQKYYETSQKHLDSALVYAEQTNDLAASAFSNQLKSQIFEDQGNTSEALRRYKMYSNQILQSLAQSQATKVTEISAKFNYEKIEQQAKETENKRKTTTYVLILAGIILMVVSIAFVTTMKKNKRIKAAEENIKQQLKEKEFLLRELNHRVKNNLALILSLVKFQYSEIDNLLYKEKFISLERRIKTIASAHEQLLYNKENLDGENYDVKEYLSQIVNALLDISTRKVNLNTSVPDFKLNIDTVLPIGILINELVSNSIKHAVCDDGLVLDIEISINKNQIFIRYKDSGILFKPPKNKLSLGVSIIESMVLQLNGTIKRVNSEYFLMVETKNLKRAS